MRLLVAANCVKRALPQFALASLHERNVRPSRAVSVSVSVCRHLRGSYRICLFGCCVRMSMCFFLLTRSVREVLVVKSTAQNKTPAAHGNNIMLSYANNNAWSIGASKKLRANQTKKDKLHTNSHRKLQQHQRQQQQQKTPHLHHHQQHHILDSCALWRMPCVFRASSFTLSRRVRVACGRCCRRENATR